MKRMAALKKEGFWREDGKYVREIFVLFGDAEYACGLREGLRLSMIVVSTAGLGGLYVYLNTGV